MKIETLLGLYPHGTAWIVGKGPSLANLTRAQIGKGPVIALNQAIVRIEALDLANPVYSMQKDGCGLKVPHDYCGGDMVRPQRATVLLHELESPFCLGDYEPRVFFNNPESFGIPWCEISTVTALCVAKTWGCTKAIFCCCDAMVTGDLRTWTPAGAELVPALAAQYRVHRQRIESVKGIEIEWQHP